MCTYNGSRYLSAQLDSIRAQTRPPHELIICDDASTDDTTRIVAHFAASVSFPVRLEVNTYTLGSTKNFEKVIGLCGGTLIALADQDDVWLPHKLETLAGEFSRRPDVGLVFSDADVVDEHLHLLGVRLWASIGFDEEQKSKLKSNRRLEVLLPGWTVTGATMAFRSTYKELARDIPTNLALIHDGWIALMIASVAEVIFIDKPLIKYRQHAQQQVGAKENVHDEAGTGLISVTTAMRRKNSYDQMIEIGLQAQRRLAELNSMYATDDAVKRLNARVQHLQIRANLPKGVIKRARCVFSELVSRRYHLYSNGMYSALKDLLA